MKKINKLCLITLILTFLIGFFAPIISNINIDVYASELTSNTASGSVDDGGKLAVITWKEWIFVTKSHDQAQYVGGDVGRYV